MHIPKYHFLRSFMFLGWLNVLKKNQQVAAKHGRDTELELQIGLTAHFTLASMRKSARC